MVLSLNKHPSLTGNPHTASVVVCAGRGLKTSPCLEKMLLLADGLRAQAVGTRAALDMGWIPENREVGLSGLRLAPEIYLAFGVSGANFHTIGMHRSSFILSVNTDPKSRIFRLSDYCVYAHAEEVLEDLLSDLPDASLASLADIKDYIISRVEKYPHHINEIRIND